MSLLLEINRTVEWTKIRSNEPTSTKKKGEMLIYN